MNGLTPHEQIFEETKKGLDALRVSIINQWGESRGCQFRYGPEGGWQWSEDGGATWYDHDYNDEYKEHAMAAFEHGVSIYLKLHCGGIDSDLFPQSEVNWINNH